MKTIKKEYEAMKVELVGTVSSVVNKSGSYTDLSGNWEGKGFDAGGGQEKNKK